MDPYIVLICFSVIFLDELPDKTRFAGLVMATNGRPGQVWVGAAGAFVVHVATAVGSASPFLPSRPDRLSVQSSPPCSSSARPVHGWPGPTWELTTASNPTWNDSSQRSGWPGRVTTPPTTWRVRVGGPRGP